MQESIVFLLREQCRRKESSRSLSHLMMSFLYYLSDYRLSFIPAIKLHLLDGFSLHCSGDTVQLAPPTSLRRTSLCRAVYWQSRLVACSFFCRNHVVRVNCENGLNNSNIATASRTALIRTHSNKSSNIVDSTDAKQRKALHC